MADLSVKIDGVEFSNPLIAASGTFGFGKEYGEFYPLSKLGGISCKGITLKRRDGNPPPRIAETPSGIRDTVGVSGWTQFQHTAVNPGGRYSARNTRIPYLIFSSRIAVGRDRCIECPG